MAGYSGTPLPRKLGVKEGDRVLLDRAPAGFDLGEPGAVVLRRLPAARDLDASLTFHWRRVDLERRLPDLCDRTRMAGMVWVCWPKRAAQQSLGLVSDLDGNVVRDIGLRTGWVDVKVAAVDETWSALKFVRRLTDR
jgi:hypothetical protein